MGCKMSTQRRKTRKTKKNEEIAPQLPEIDDISKLKRRELQRLCKRLSIKANGKVSCGHAKLLIDLSFRTKSVSHGSEWHPEILPYSRVKSCNKRHLSGSIYECRLLLVFLAPCMDCCTAGFFSHISALLSKRGVGGGFHSQEAESPPWS